MINRKNLALQLIGLGLTGVGAMLLFRYWDRLQAETFPPQMPHEIKQPIAAQPSTSVQSDPILAGAGDIATCDVQEDTLTAQVLDKIPGTIFTAGDNVYPKGKAEEFQNCYESAWGHLKSRTYPSPGNHDYYSPNAAPYYAYFGDRAGPAGRGFYSYDLGQWHIVSLNSNVDAQKGSEQEKWLRADLAAHPKTCTLAYWHHPVFSSGVHGNNPKMQDIWQTLSEFGADVIVNGHDHNYERFAPQTAEGKADPKGIRAFVVGTGGVHLRPMMTTQPNSEVRESNTHGVIKFTLRSQSYDWEFVPIHGQTFSDKGTGNCVNKA